MELNPAVWVYGINKEDAYKINRLCYANQKNIQEIIMHIGMSYGMNKSTGFSTWEDYYKATRLTKFVFNRVDVNNVYDFIYGPIKDGGKKFFWW